MRHVFGTMAEECGGHTVGGRYVLVGRLGEGGMGQVYRARHVELGKLFALKVISPAFAEDSVARARFNREAKLASELSHPNIVSVVDYGEDAHFGAFMVMELVDGDPIFGEHTDPISVRRACEVLGNIADALDYVHKQGIVHGDVKAENILLVTESNGRRRRRIARLLDFGLARRHIDDAEQQLSGSPHYLAPERAAGGPASVSTDVYALGVLGYVLLTGELPFNGSVLDVMMGHIEKEAPRMSLRCGERLDDALEALIARAMAKDPAARHASAAAFRYELNTVMHMLGMRRRRASSQNERRIVNARDMSIVGAFEQSRLPQALVSADREITRANSAFTKLIGLDSVEGIALADTALAKFVPHLLKTVRAVHVTGKADECRARVPRRDNPALELVVWLSPLSLQGSEIHVVVRVTELAEEQ
jgi:serine/threonine protein kinase